MPTPNRITVLTFHLLPAAASITNNPLRGMPADQIERALWNVMSSALDEEEQEELQDTLEALVPALVWLRDRHGEPLTLQTLTHRATLPGFSGLSIDQRLTPLMRAHCEAMARRHRFYWHKAKAVANARRDHDEGLA